MFKFEKVLKYKDVEIAEPMRKTNNSAAYDMVAAEDIVILPMSRMMNVIGETVVNSRRTEEVNKLVESFVEKKDYETAQKILDSSLTCTTDEIADLTKALGCRPTLIPTGYKAYMPKDYSLDLYVRSSSPLKYWIILANSTGIIDSDYVDNPDNEGHIFFQVINLLPIPLLIKKGEIIGQAKFVKFATTDNDAEQKKEIRAGGFGSTSEATVVEEVNE